jgi:hypothetical protein
MELKDIKLKLESMIGEIDAVMNLSNEVKTETAEIIKPIEVVEDTTTVEDITETLETEIVNTEMEIPADRLAWNMEEWKIKDSEGLATLIETKHSHYQKLKTDLTALYNSVSKNYPVL